MSEKRIATWDELAGSGSGFFKEVRLPAASTVAGEDVFCKVRGLTPLELVKCYNIPLAEVEHLAEEDPTGDKVVAALQEQVKTFSPEDILETMEQVCRVGLVEPEPQEGVKLTDRLGEDSMVVFQAVVDASTGDKEAKEQAARFPEVGER